MDHDLHTLLLSAAVGSLTVLLVWLTNRLLNRKAQGRSLLTAREGNRLAARALRDHQEPLPVLDGQEPHFAIYAAPAGDETTACTCHGIPFADGDRILIWPVETLLCSYTYGSDPGIDISMSPAKRAEIMSYLRSKYGSDPLLSKVAHWAQDQEGPHES